MTPLPWHGDAVGGVHPIAYALRAGSRVNQQQIQDIERRRVRQSMLESLRPINPSSTNSRTILTGVETPLAP